jgi:hypothetical protein
MTDLRARKQGVPMFNTPTFLPQKSPFVPKLLLIIEPDLARGDMLIQTIRKETPYQAILATSMLDARHIFEHLKCDLCLLADSLLPMAEEFFQYLNTLAGYERIAIYFFTAAVLGEQPSLPNQPGSFERTRLLQAIQHLLNESGSISGAWRETRG